MVRVCPLSVDGVCGGPVRWLDSAVGPFGGWVPLWARRWLDYVVDPIRWVDSVVAPVDDWITWRVRFRCR